MRAAVLKQPGVVEMDERPIPQPGANHVRVRVASVGLCGSDVHYYRHGRIGRYVVEGPLILGHECSGIIDAVGPGVSPSRVGQRVVVEPGVPCRRCRWCKAGRYNLCPEMQFMATPPVDGALTDFVLVPDDFAHVVPDSLSLAEAALIEPTAVAVHAARRGGVAPGATTAVFGAGPVGLLVLQVVRAFGALRTYVIDPEPSRLDVASRLGANAVLHPSDLADVHNIDVAFDASGNAAALADSIQATRPGGTVVWIGLPSQEAVPIPAGTLIDKELDLRGVFRYVNAHPLAIDLMASGALTAGPLITHRFPLERTADALDLTASREPGVVKVLIEPNPE